MPRIPIFQNDVGAMSGFQFAMAAASTSRQSTAPMAETPFGRGDPERYCLPIENTEDRLETPTHLPIKKLRKGPKAPDPQAHGVGCFGGQEKLQTVGAPLNKLTKSAEKFVGYPNLGDPFYEDLSEQCGSIALDIQQLLSPFSDPRMVQHISRVEDVVSNLQEAQSKVDMLFLGAVDRIPVQCLANCFGDATKDSGAKKSVMEMLMLRRKATALLKQWKRADKRLSAIENIGTSSTDKELKPIAHESPRCTPVYAKSARAKRLKAIAHKSPRCKPVHAKSARAKPKRAERPLPPSPSIMNTRGKSSRRPVIQKVQNHRHTKKGKRKAAPSPAMKVARAVPKKATQSFSKKPAQSVIKEPVQSVTKKPAQSVTKEPVQSVTKKPAQSVTKEPVQSVTKKPAQSVTKEPVQSVTKKPAQSVTKKPAQSVTKEPVQSVTKKPAQSVTKKPAQSVTKEPVQSVTKKPAQSVTKEPAQSITQKPKPAQSVTKQLKQAQSVIKKPAQSVTNKPKPAQFIPGKAAQVQNRKRKRKI